MRATRIAAPDAALARDRQPRARLHQKARRMSARAFPVVLVENQVRSRCVRAPAVPQHFLKRFRGRNSFRVAGKGNSGRAHCDFVRSTECAWSAGAPLAALSASIRSCTVSAPASTSSSSRMANVFSRRSSNSTRSRLPRPNSRSRCDLSPPTERRNCALVRRPVRAQLRARALHLLTASNCRAGDTIDSSPGYSERTGGALLSVG